MNMNMIMESLEKLPSILWVNYEEISKFPHNNFTFAPVSHSGATFSHWIVKATADPD